MYANPAIRDLKDQLEALLAYCPETGLFRWRADRRYAAKAGDVAGTITAKGYRYIQVNRKGYRAARLAWLFVHGKWPEHQIDHLNGVRDDDRIGNLRDITAQQNSIKHVIDRSAFSSAKLGVSRRPNGKWGAYLTRNSGTKAVGVFATEFEAEQAFLFARAAADEGIFGVATPLYEHVAS